MKKIDRRRKVLAVCALAAGLLPQNCIAFWQNELEALLAPTANGNALAVLNSVFFELLAPLLY